MPSDIVCEKVPNREMTIRTYSLGLLGVSILTALLTTTDAFAREDMGGQLQVSGGIAMPATSTAVFSNPAGLVSADRALVLQAEAPEVWDSGTYRAGVQTGGSSYGIAAGAEMQDAGSHNPLSAYYGIAVGTEAFTLGFAGQTGVSNSSGSTFNAGTLFKVGANSRIGFTARDIGNGVSEWGLGLAVGVATGVDIVVDSAADRNLDNLQIKPGIKVSSGQAALTLSYATGEREEFANGFSAGASFQFASKNTIEFEYNPGGDLSKYFVGLTLAF
jgi:hypothetical protein